MGETCSTCNLLKGEDMEVTTKPHYKTTTTQNEVPAKKSGNNNTSNTQNTVASICI